MMIQAHNPIVRFMFSLGHSARTFVSDTLTPSLKFYGITISNMCRLKFYSSQIPRYILEINFLSLNVVSLTSFFTGAVLTIQTYDALDIFATSSQVANVVITAVVRELGPVLTGLIIAGRVSSAIAAEISTMKNSDQISALETLSIDPIPFLITPRVFVGMLLMPALIVVSDIISVFGSYIVAVYAFNYDPLRYLMDIIKHFSLDDFYVGSVKAFTFGFIITISGSAMGMLSEIGSTGVGKATTSAVVKSSTLLILFNYLISSLAF